MMDHCVDDCESCLERLEKDPYNQSNPRLLLDALREVLHNAQVDHFLRFLAVLESMVAQPESYVRQDVIDLIPKLAVVCEEFDQKPNIVDRHLVPIVLESLTDSDVKVRKAGQTSLLVMLEQDMLSEKVVENSICPFVVALTHFPLANGITLMGKLAQLLGKDATVRLFLDKFALCCDEAMPALREACARNFGGMCAVLGSELSTTKMVPLFCDLCDDEDWVVRKACTEVFMLVSCAVPLETRRTVLTPRFMRLLSDNDNRVSAMAFQVLGAFICTFADPPLTGIAYDVCGELVFVGPESSKFRIASQQNLPFTRSSEIGRGNDFSSLPFCRNDSMDESNQGEDDEDAFNTFRFWKLPVLDLEVALEDEEIQANLASLDSELTSLSEKLDKCSSKDLGKRDESVISEASTPDSGWNSGANTPLHPQTPLILRMPSSYLGSCDGKNTPATSINSKPAQTVVPQPLLDSYLSMSDQFLHGELFKEFTLYCAYFLPGVASTLGPSNWPWLVDLYSNFAVDRQWKVRKTAASSLYNMGLMLGREITNRDLAPILRALLKDLDEVRMGALQSLSSTLGLFDTSVRESFLPLLRDFICPGSSSDGDRNWRFRRELAFQLSNCCSLFSASDLPDYFGSPVFSLLKDKIAAVRAMAVKLMSEMILRMEKEPALLAPTLEFILEEFAGSNHWSHRVVFTQICSEIAFQQAIPIEEFSTNLMAPLLRLANDNVPNVRICVARCIARNILGNGYLDSSCSSFKQVSETLDTLKEDWDRDVKEAAMFEVSPRHSADSFGEGEGDTSDGKLPILEDYYFHNRTPVT